MNASPNARMKPTHKSLLFSGILCFALAVGNTPVYADSEPNNDPAHASVLAINASSNGALSDSDAVDWWKIVLPADGKLVINTTASDSSLDIDLFIYDSDGSSEIARFDTSLGIREATHFNNLKAGTYYIKALNYAGSGDYLINSNFTACSLNSDPEPNEWPTNASTLAPNGSSTGHLGYFGNGKTDEDDWWKVTIAEDGKLIVNTTSEAGLDIDLKLYDSDGKTMIARFDTSLGIHEAVHYDHLAPGTYYVNAYPYIGYGSYSISSIFEAVNGPNDKENNNSVQNALVLTLNGSDKGRLGYSNRDYTDKVDWWKVSVLADGKLTVSTVSDTSLDIDLTLYDGDGKTFLAGYDINTGINEATHYDHLLPGTYFVEAKRFKGHGAYSIQSNFSPAEYANDSDNEDIAQAAPLALRTLTSGHIGYQGNGKADEEDWWVFTITQTDTVSINVETTGTSDVLDMRLYKDPDHSEPYLRSGRTDQFEIIRDELGPGKYYINIYRFGKGYGSYKMSVSPQNPSSKISAHALISKQVLYPNPVENEATLAFSTAESGQYAISLVDINGRQVAAIFNGMLPAGDQQFQIDASNLAAGTYWCRILGEKELSVKTLVIAK